MWKNYSGYLILFALLVVLLLTGIAIDLFTDGTVSLDSISDYGGRFSLVAIILFYLHGNFQKTGYSQVALSAILLFLIFLAVGMLTNASVFVHQPIMTFSLAAVFLVPCICYLLYFLKKPEKSLLAYLKLATVLLFALAVFLRLSRIDHAMEAKLAAASVTVLAVVCLFMEEYKARRLRSNSATS